MNVRVSMSKELVLNLLLLFKDVGV
jgi:hypothetical protein